MPLPFVCRVNENFFTLRIFVSFASLSWGCGMSETLLPSAAASSLIGTAFSSQEFAKVILQKDSADLGKHFCCFFWFKIDGHFNPGHCLYVN